MLTSSRSALVRFSLHGPGCSKPDQTNPGLANFYFSIPDDLIRKQTRTYRSALMYHNASVLVENPFHIQKQINRKVSAWSFHMINFKFLLQRTRKYNHTLWRTLLFIALLRWNQSDYTTNSHSSLIHFLFKWLGGKEFPRNWASNTVTRQVSRTYCSYCCMVIKSRICHLHRMNLAASAWKELCVRITTRSGTCCTNNMPLFKRLDNTRLYPAWKLRGRKQASITWSVSEENQHSNSC